MSRASVLPGGKVRCEPCPRYCTMKEDRRGFCFVRRATGDDVVLTSYGRASGCCVDPIETKPLNHFYPDTSVLSFGTAGYGVPLVDRFDPTPGDWGPRRRRLRVQA